MVWTSDLVTELINSVKAIPERLNELLAPVVGTSFGATMDPMTAGVSGGVGSSGGNNDRLVAALDSYKPDFNRLTTALDGLRSSIDLLRTRLEHVNIGGGAERHEEARQARAMASTIAAGGGRPATPGSEPIRRSLEDIVSKRFGVTPEYIRDNPDLFSGISASDLGVKQRVLNAADQLKAGATQGQVDAIKRLRELAEGPQKGGVNKDQLAWIKAMRSDMAGPGKMGASDEQLAYLKNMLGAGTRGATEEEVAAARAMMFESGTVGASADQLKWVKAMRTDMAGPGKVGATPDQLSVLKNIIGPGTTGATAEQMRALHQIQSANANQVWWTPGATGPRPGMAGNAPGGLMGALKGIFSQGTAGLAQGSPLAMLGSVLGGQLGYNVGHALLGRVGAWAGAAAGGGMGAGLAMSAAGSALGTFSAGIGLAVVALAKFSSFIEGAAQQQVASLAKYGAYSGVIAGSMANYEVSGIMRNIRIANAVEGTTAAMTQKTSQFEDLTATFGIAGTNIKNGALAFGEGLATPALKALAVPTNLFNWMMEGERGYAATQSANVMGQMVGGAMAGAAAGAAVGFWIPVPGATAAGAVIGGLIGTAFGTVSGIADLDEGKPPQDLIGDAIRSMLSANGFGPLTS